MSARVVTAVLFYPRGGSSHVARALARELRAQGWRVTLVSGSRSDLGGYSDAKRFYGEVHAVDFGPALSSEDAMRFEGPLGTAPLHPSFEDRPGAPDVVFAALDELAYERQVRSWARELERAGAGAADVLHLHHLTPLNEAAARVAPDVPVVSQLHGTELLMLEQIEAGAPPGWRHAEAWASRLRGWAEHCERLTANPAAVDRAVGLLGVSRDHIAPLRSGVDLELFHPRPVDRQHFWHRVLVQQPRGWLPGRGPGSSHYGEADVARLETGTTLLYVGRFTAVKRLDLLIEAFEEAQRRASTPANLVLVGGHPGEWEGEHPADVAARLRVAGVFLAGWYGHDELPPFFCAADAVVLSSAREQFGLVLVEGMACGIPAVASRSVGPESIIDDGVTGWLVADDRHALVSALVEVIEDEAERRRRGAAAREVALRRFSWSSVAGELSALLKEAALSSAGSARGAAPTS